MTQSAEKNVLAVDVGNTVTRLGLFSGEELSGTFELTTPERLTADEAWLRLDEILGMLGVEELQGAILGCVVPTHPDAWRQALASACEARPLVVGPGLKTGIRMRYDDPSEVGADRVADVIAARETYDAPVVVVDLGTTTNFEVVDADAAAARLPMIELRAPASVIGRNTRSAMQSGVVLGEVARIDGLLDAIARELGEDATVVLTGDGAQAMAALLAHETQVDETLTLRGLHALWLANQRG